jgi:hypothetical protein
MPLPGGDLLLKFLISFLNLEPLASSWRRTFAPCHFFVSVVKERVRRLRPECTRSGWWQQSGQVDWAVESRICSSFLRMQVRLKHIVPISVPQYSMSSLNVCPTLLSIRRQTPWCIRSIGEGRHVCVCVWLFTKGGQNPCAYEVCFITFWWALIWLHRILTSPL